MELPHPPEEIELKNIIDKLAQFVARNGAEFEQMTKNKQRDNPKFSFLFGGEYFNYYQYRVTTEQAILKQKQIREQSQPMGYPGSYGPPPTTEIHNQPTGFGRSFNYASGPSSTPWNQPPPVHQQQQQQQQQQHQPPPLMQQHQLPFPGHNPAPPQSQTDLIAMKAAKDILVAQQKTLQEQIKQSEHNLAAQLQVTTQQRKQVTEDVVRQQQEKEAVQRALECSLNPPEIETILQPIIESCSKESISHGKAYILQQVNQQPHTSPETLAQYLLYKTVQSSQFVHKLHLIYLLNDVLHHCTRKGMDSLQGTLEQVVGKMFCNAHLAAVDDEQLAKLNKLLNLWQSKNSFHDRVLLEHMAQSPQLVWSEHYAALVARYQPFITAAAGGIQHTYENYRGQHQAFVNHANHQIQQLEQQKQQIEDQIAAVQAPTPQAAPYAPHSMQEFLSRPPPMPVPMEGITPKAPYFDLPAGLLVPLVRMDQHEYKSIDSKDIRLPPPLPPTERLIASVDHFFAPPHHDRPRNVDGWEQTALYEFYKEKAAAKKKKEEDLEKGVREPSPPPSPVDLDDESSSATGSGRRNGVKSPVRKRFRSESPDDEGDHSSSQREPEPSSRRGRSRSRSPRRRTTSASSRNIRSRSRSTSPPPRRAVNRSRSRSRSKSPFAMPAFQRQQQRSPTPPTELASVAFTKGHTQKLDESNRGHQLLRKMGWGGAGLGANEQGIAEPIKGGDVRDRSDQFKGVGMNIRDPFDNFRKSKGQAFITRMRSRAEEREKDRVPGSAEDPPTP